MVNLNPAKAPFHGSRAQQAVAGARPPQVARSVPALDSRVPDSLWDQEMGIRPHSCLSQTLGGAPQGERRPEPVSRSGVPTGVTPNTFHRRGR